MASDPPQTKDQTPNTSLRRVIAVFCSWKLLLLLVAAASPGPGYDTSTQILFRGYPNHSRSWLENIASKLTRWDAIYFATASERGHVFEQEWAFSPFLARITSAATTVLPFRHSSSAIVKHALTGIALSLIAHFFAVLILYRLTYAIIPAGSDRKRSIAFSTACFHTISPAGLFLSAPFGESTFAMTNFAGMLCYVLARQHRRHRRTDHSLRSGAWTVASGILFGIATMFRSNGLLSGLIFAWDAILYIPKLPGIFDQRSWHTPIHLFGTLLAGLAVAIGYALPQVVAYSQYCTAGNTRPWCSKALPSIYSFVQSHYWNVGFFRYWTASNIPLFALAAPMLLVLVGTGCAVLNSTQLRQVLDTVSARTGQGHGPVDAKASEGKDLFWHTMTRFALPQVVLAFLALFGFHVQIINRISSGYPVWYIVLAIAAVDTNSSSPRSNSQIFSVIDVLADNGQWLVRASAMYAIIQGGLYASFMPPA